MIAAELAKRRLVQLQQNLAQLFGRRVAGCKTLSVNLTQRAAAALTTLYRYTLRERRCATAQQGRGFQ
jgi:hypothetical protein